MVEDYNCSYWINEIKNASKKIDDNIKIKESLNRPLLSSNILDSLRNFVESIISLVYLSDTPNRKFGLERWKCIEISSAYIKKIDKYSELYLFHEGLQRTVSHATYIDDAAERLMLYYFEKLVYLKVFLKERFHIETLINLNQFPLNLSNDLVNYYKKILSILDKKFENNSDSFIYYVRKKKPIFLENSLFYEYTLCLAQDNFRKHSHLIAYSKVNIYPNYAIKVNFAHDSVRVLGKKFEVNIITDYSVSVRPCEFEKMAKIISLNGQFKRDKVYLHLMEYIKKHFRSLDEILCSEENIYLNFHQFISENNKLKSSLLNLIDKIRSLILSDFAGKNVLLYLLATMNNEVLKNQIYKMPNSSVSNLCLKKGVLIFDETPFCSSLIKHNPTLITLLKTLDSSNREDELLKRYLSNISNENNQLYIEIPKNQTELIGQLIERHNSKLTYRKQIRSISKVYRYVCLEENEDNTKKVLEKLIYYKDNNFFSINDSLHLNFLNSEDNIRKKIGDIIGKSSLLCIYGEAGSGKSTLVSQIINFFSDKSVIVLAKTHSATENLKRKITINAVRISTIDKFLNNKESSEEVDILVLDECSVVPTSDMAKILVFVKPKLIILSGDIKQLQSIKFGNWFSLFKNFISNKMILELSQIYRTNSEVLTKLWESVRKNDNFLHEILVNSKISCNINEELFKKDDDDEVILCLNYDGLYGINNLNKILQESNPNREVELNNFIYKINDPVIFIDSNQFGGYLYNNLKGKILNISENNNYVTFELLVDRTFDANINDMNYGFSLIENMDNKARINLDIYRISSNDFDNEVPSSKQIPFQISYAISIHKAQGLEFNSVKIVISDEIEEKLNLNIFYTAITRAKTKLKIFWSPEAQQKIISNFSENKTEKIIMRDSNILSSKYKFRICK